MSVVILPPYREPGTAITSQPSMLLSGRSTAFITVAANGTAPITYQWQNLSLRFGPTLANGGDISGATSANLQIANIDAPMQVVIAAWCIAIADPMSIVMLPTLTVNPATAITSQPSNVTQCAGTTASFIVAANGTAPITYQWQKFVASVWTNLSNGGDISGATSNNLQIANIDATDAGSYAAWCIAIAELMLPVIQLPHCEPCNSHYITAF